MTGKRNPLWGLAIKVLVCSALAAGANAITDRLAEAETDDTAVLRERSRRAVPPVAGYAGRLRKRASWVNHLSEALGLRRGYLGVVLGGRWRPDLPAFDCSREAPAYLAALLHYGAKVEGHSWLYGGEQGRIMAIQLSLGSVRVLVIPELTALLSVYAGFRKRDANLLSALKLRALEWSKARDMLPWDMALTLLPSVALATLRNEPELAAVSILESRVGIAAAEGRDVGLFGALGPYARPMGGLLSSASRQWYMSSA